ncbi:NAD(P)-dependent alcohol dehydrogenase [Rhodococcus rhodnii]|nr:NAD(P)-dependent alcohol dehydrogenase [Rhodococcus rhodnii]TXG90983.1 NAD(P)-dependent alcohol dehydrogenase [Rhodococcus rhodnii]
MRVSVLHPGGSITEERRPIPAPGPGDVLVQIASVGVCGSDTHYYRHGRIGEFVVDTPLVLGHEASGRIVAVGAGVAEGRVGQRVSIEPQRPDPASAESLRGDYNLSPNLDFFATPPVDGAFAEYVTIGSAFAHAVPDTIGDDAAALLEPLSVAIAALRKARVGLGSAILVAGAGPVGLLCVQVARAAGATVIAVSEPDDARREQARRHGATHVFSPPDRPDPGVPIDAFVDASGVPAAVRSGIDAVRPGGGVVLVGMGADEMTLPVSLIQNRELTLTGVFRYANTWPTAIALVASGAVDLDSLVTGRFGLAEVPAALDSDRVAGSIKVIVRPADRTLRGGTS